MCSRGIFLLCWKQQQQRWYFEKVRNHTLHSASAQTNQRMQYRDSISMPLNLHTCEAAVTFMDRSWFPHLQVALWMAAAAPACLCYWCNLFSNESASGELLWISGYIFFQLFFSLPPYWSRTRKSQREINCLLCYLIYQKAEVISTSVAWWIVFSMNHTMTWCIDFSMTEHFFGVPVWQVVLEDLGLNRFCSGQP